MKLLKKIAPLAISALMLAAPLAGAVNIANWDDTFTSSSTAVVVGSGTIGTEDMAAALTVARAVGIDTEVTNTVGGETYYIEKSSNKFNLGNNFTDIITGSIDESELPTILAKGLYLDINSDEREYDQDISFATNRQLRHFSDSSYEGGEPTLGIYVPSSGYVLNYTLDFSSEPDWDDADLEKTTIDMMGKPYYISHVGDTGTSTITLLDVSETKTIGEGASDVLGGKTVKVTYISSTSTVKIEVDGKSSNALAAGAVYNLGGGKYIAVKDVMYVAKDTGTSQVELAIGNGKIDLVNHELVEINDEDIEGLTAHIDNSSTKLQSITLQWATDEEAFITKDSTITLPGFETVTLGMGDFYFPTEEETQISAGDEYLEIVVPIESGEATIPLLYTNTTHFVNLGEESGKALKTATISNLVFNESADDAAFIATWVSGEEAETYYLKAVVKQTSSGTNYTEVTDLVSDDMVSCEEGEDCEIGNVVLTALDVNYVSSNTNRWVNFTAGTGVNFYKIYTKEGLLIYAPHTTSGTPGYFNTVGSTTYVLQFDEEDKEGTFAGGEEFNMTAGISSANAGRVTITTLTSNWSGGDYFELDSEQDTYVGYVWSDLATKLTWDTSGDEDPVTVTYHGAESYGKVYITEGTATTSSSSWTAVKDSETSAYTGKNVIAIGGTAVNKVARKMLGLDEATPVFGSDSAWSTATGVNAVGKGILWIKTSPYTTGKYAMLVAGYEGADTEKTANFLTLKASTLAKDKAVIDTVNNVEATA